MRRVSFNASRIAYANRLLGVNAFPSGSNSSIGHVQQVRSMGFGRRDKQGWVKNVRASKEENPLNVERPMLKFKEMLAELDTTLSPEERARVERLKTKYIFGPNEHKRTPYRNVPTTEEQDATPDDQQYRTYVPPNAEEIIDWALSHIPDREGKRGTRRAKRFSHRHELRRKNAAWRRQGEQRSIERKMEKRAKQRELANIYREMAAEMRMSAEGDSGAESSEKQ